MQAMIFLLAVGVGYSWSQVGTGIDGGAGDKAGRSTSLNADGTILAIGAPMDGDAGTWAGHVRVFQYSAGVWAQLGADIDGETPLDKSGDSICLSADGMRIAIGADGADGGGSSSGHVRVFEYSKDAGAWSQIGATIDGEATGDVSGERQSVSLSADGTRVAIGAYGNDGAGSTADVGHVRVFEFSAGAWSQVGTDIDGEVAGDKSGDAVSLSADGTRVAIGAKWHDGAAGANSGHVRVFEDNRGVWSLVGAAIDGDTMYSQSGGSVSLSADGSRVAIGAASRDQVRVFEYSADAWSQVGPNIAGESSNDQFGESVSLSADGMRVAIGAHLNDGNGSNAGHVRVFAFSGAAWSQVGTDIDGEAAGDLFGFSVSLSADGTHVAIGAPMNDGAGDNAGRVRVYVDPTSLTAPPPTPPPPAAPESESPALEATVTVQPGGTLAVASGGVLRIGGAA